MNCVTQIDSISINGMGLTVMYINTVRTVQMRRRGLSKVERQQVRWLRAASFVREVGHDPFELLGPPPMGAPKSVLVEDAEIARCELVTAG